LGGAEVQKWYQKVPVLLVLLAALLVTPSCRLSESELDELRGTVTSLESQISDLENKVSDLESAVEELERRTDEHQFSLDDLDGRVSELELR
jgi:peptidoglycan hydrolase CwlO-like protein